MRSLFSLLFVVTILSGHGQKKALSINHGFKEKQLNSYVRVVSAKNLLEAQKKLNSGDTIKVARKDFFYFNFQNQYRYLFFEINNISSGEQTALLKFSNALIREVELFELTEDEFAKIASTGVEHMFNSRPEFHRNFVLPIKLEGHSSKDFIIKLKKETGRPLVTSISAVNPFDFKKESTREYWIMGLYFGLCFIAALFSFFAFAYLRNLLYLYYGLYVIALGLYISSYLGLFYQFLVPENQLFNTYFNYVFFSELSLVLFILFSQKALNTKFHTPKLKRLIEGLAIVLISLRLLLHFVFTSAFESYVKIFMLIWYGFMVLATAVIIIQTIVYFQKDKSKGSLFAFGLLFLEVGALATIFYHSSGLFNTYLGGFPVLFYCSALEVIFLTFFVVYMVKDISDERNAMSKIIASQQKRILTSFIKGEARERERIGKELHDNIGSQLTRLKLSIGNTNEKELLEADIDKICEDVRDLSHAISPKELKLVSFVKAIEELSYDITDKLNLSITVSNFDFPEELQSPYREELYRVIQEALNNVIKHAGATQTEIQLFQHDKELSISIEDNGKGFNYPQKQEGFGLNSMKTRIKNLQGTFSVDSRENEGTLLLINVPYS